MTSGGKLKLDWQNAVIAGATVVLLFSCGKSLLYPSRKAPADELPPEAASVAGHLPDGTGVEQAHAADADASTITFVTPPRRTDPTEVNQEGVLAPAQLDYETFRTLQTQAIHTLKQRLRTNEDARGDGVTEQQLDQMLKDGYLPQ